MSKYSVVSIKQNGGNKRTAWSDFFLLLHERELKGEQKKLLREKI